MPTRFPLLLLLICLFALPGRAQETGLAACADGMDNDGNGLTDCDDPACARLTEGCRLCGETSSFADSVLTFREGCGRRTVNPRSTLGVADFAVSPTNNSRYMITGEGGWLKLAFTDNILINSGNTEPDIHVFEVEAILQETRISLRPLDDFTRDALIARGVPDTDGDGFFEFGIVDMNRRNLDIDGRIPGFARGLLRFDAVEVRDIDDGNCRSAETPGMDLDAVCALSSLPVTDCNGVRFGPGVVDDCGICLERTDPAFNQSCADCAGVPSGPAVVDSCGVCLPREDPGFGQSCRDCLGVTNGTAAPDSCGVCRAPGDVAFNSTCRDCAGVLNGPARTDDCGICRDTTDARASTWAATPRAMSTCRMPFPRTPTG